MGAMVCGARNQKITVRKVREATGMFLYQDKRQRRETPSLSERARVDVDDLFARSPLGDVIDGQIRLMGIEIYRCREDLMEIKGGWDWSRSSKRKPQWKG